jgi:Mut7-C ubiquitin
MRITFKLYASLTEYLPSERGTGNQVTLDVPAGATIAAVVAPFNLPMKLVHLVLINGELVEGDVLAIWPPIAGG